MSTAGLITAPDMCKSLFCACTWRWYSLLPCVPQRQKPKVHRALTVLLCTELYAA